MSGLIPESVLEEILSRVNIVEVISACIPLKRAGRNFKANCPFHHEKTPSFMVSPDRQIFHCFGCGESGNAFKFLMKHERLDFPEAVETLAKKTGVILPQGTAQDAKTDNLFTQLYKVNEFTAGFYENNLDSLSCKAAKEYLLKRGLKQETINTLRLGFAPDKWDGLINYLRQKSLNLSLMEKAGVILAKDKGGYYDRFRNRIIFPIVDIKSRILGFGARVLDASLPKYINSPETPVYTKGKNLYGIGLAKDSIRELDCVVVVEGYLDFILPFQEGLKNIVASLGTALTLEQVRMLKRYTHNVVMIYDPDAAGETATLRSLDIFIEEDMSVRVVTLPKGLDPDSFVRKHGIEALKEKVKLATNLFDYKLGVLKSRYDYKDIQAKAVIAGQMLETVNKFNNAVLKSEYIKRLAQELDIKEEALFQEVKKFKKNKPELEPARQYPLKPLAINPTEKLLLKLMLEEAQLINSIRDSLEPADFQDERASKIVSILFDLASQGKNMEPNFLMEYFQDNDISELVCESVFADERSESKQHKEKVVSDCISRLKAEKLRLKKNYLHEQIKLAQSLGDEDKLQKLMEEFQFLAKKK